MPQGPVGPSGGGGDGRALPFHITEEEALGRRLCLEIVEHGRHALGERLRDDRLLRLFAPDEPADHPLVEKPPEETSPIRVSGVLLEPARPRAIGDVRG
jgi:hypothetical protein